MENQYAPTEKPVEPKFYGHLTLGHNVPYGTLYLDIFAVHAFDFATLHLSRGIRPISPSSNILLRVNSHRIFSLSLHCSLLIEYYSMIVATRPDPTVRPPSRYQTGVLRYTNSDFLCDLCGKIRIFRCVRVVFRNFCYHGVITVFLVFLAYFFLHS